MGCFALYVHWDHHRRLEVNLFCLVYAMKDLYDQSSLHTSRLPLIANRRHRIPRHKRYMRDFSDRIQGAMEEEAIVR